MTRPSIRKIDFTLFCLLMFSSGVLIVELVIMYILEIGHAHFRNDVASAALAIALFTKMSLNNDRELMQKSIEKGPVVFKNAKEWFVKFFLLFMHLGVGVFATKAITIHYTGIPIVLSTAIVIAITTLSMMFSRYCHKLRSLDTSPNPEYKIDRSFLFFTPIFVIALGNFFTGVLIPEKNNYAALGLGIAISSVLAFIDLKKSMLESITKFPVFTQKLMNFLIRICFVAIHAVAGMLITISITGATKTDVKSVAIWLTATLLSLGFSKSCHEKNF